MCAALTFAAMHIPIDLLAYRPQLRTQSGQIFDPIRRRYFVLTPEELVRQLLLCHLTSPAVGYPRNAISVEKQIIVNGRRKRFDLLVYSPKGLPVMLIECKAPSVPIDAAVLHQVATYNHALQVRHFAMTNGQRLFCGCVEPSGISYLPELPPYERL